MRASLLKNLTSKALPVKERPSPLLLSARELAALLSISVPTVWRLRSMGKLPRAAKLGGSVRWRTEEINRWIEAGMPDLRTWEASQQRR